MKVAIISGSRSEFYLLKNLIINFKKDKNIKLYFGITGSHLTNFFGNTVQEIKKEKIKIDYKINLFIKNDKKKNILEYLSNAIKGCSKFLNKFCPDILIILGDRYEIYSAAIAAYLNRIPIAHIHGGEKTIGSLDDGLRHSITKLSQIHFVSNNAYYRRVLQLGENKKFIFNVGSLGAEAIKKIKFITKTDLERSLKIKFLKKNIIVTYHPETTLKKEQNIKNLKIFLSSLKELKETCIIFTMPNADPGFKTYVKLIKSFIKRKKNSYFFKNLGHQKYYSICKQVDLMIGNSSSGIIEMPVFKKGTINIGNRQNGREKSNSILDVEFKKRKILKKIKFAYTNQFKRILIKTKSLYKKKNTTKMILRILKKIDLNEAINKNFIDYNIKQI